MIKESSYEFENELRARIIDKTEKKVLIANLYNSLEEKDNYTKINCNGFGRVRIFKDFKLHLFKNPIFHKPFYRNYPITPIFQTQVFQISACNWKCWYCFVDNKLLEGNKEFGKFLSPNEIIDMLLKEQEFPHIIDLSGGQPDLVPEWILWFLEAIDEHGLKGKIYIWSDDNLSTNFLWKFLTLDQIEYIRKFPLFNKVCCLKGYNIKSFCFNTRANAEDFENQFTYLSKLIESGFDVYSYVTFTTPSIQNILFDMKYFVEKLINIHPLLPLRIIPLKITRFSNTRSRSENIHDISLRLQEKVVETWEKEILKNYSYHQIQKSYSDIKLN